MTARSQLLHDIDETADAIPMLSTAPFVMPARLLLGEEVVYCLDKTNTDLITCSRGQEQSLGGSIPTPHAGGIIITQAGNATPATSPTILDFTYAQHDHGDVDDGGPILSAAMTGGFACFGPFSVSNLAATATIGVFTAFATSNTTFDLTGDAGNIYMPRAGRIIAGFMATNTGRTAGTAKLRAFVNGAQDTTIDYATIDGTHTFQHGAFSAVGTPFAAGDVAGMGVVTTGWAPTTADVWAYFWVRFD